MVTRVSPRSPLFGREAEVKILGEALDQVAAGRPVVMLVDGEAGIGKTRLLAAVLADATGRGMQVVTGRAEELERNRPFGLLAGAFGCSPGSRDPRRAAIGALLSGQGHSGERVSVTVSSDPGLQFRVVDAFCDLVEELALVEPLVVALDDLQWADPSSLLAIGAISRRGACPVALICCFRPAPRVPDLDRLAAALDAAGARRLTVRPLPAGPVRELVAEVVGAEPGQHLLAEISGTGGNPLYITELLGALLQEGAIRRTDGRAEVGETTLPPTLRLTILRRLSFLGDDPLQTLRAASLLGSAFSLTDLATITGRPAGELFAALDEALRAQVVEEHGADLRFRHDLIRDALYQDLPVTVRRGLHREAGQRLAGSGAPALQVAEQLARGATRGDADAIGWLTRAAADAASTSPRVAADLLHRAVGLMEPTDPGRDSLIAERAGNLIWAGRISDSVAICRRLLQRPHDPGADARVRICLGQALLSQGQVREALRELERVAGAPAPSAVERAAALAWGGLARVSLGDLAGAAAMAEQARAAAEAAGDHLSTSIALATLCRIARSRGDLHDALRLAEDAVCRAERSPGRVGHRFPVQESRGHTLVELDRLAEARAAFDAGMRISEHLGVRWPLVSYQVFQALADFVGGAWDDAVAGLQATLEQAEEAGETYNRMYAHGLLALIALHRNDLAGAREHVDVAVHRLAGGDTRNRAQWALWAHALLLEADGRDAEALTTLFEVWQHCQKSGLALEVRLLGPDLVRLAGTAGDQACAEGVAEAVTALAASNDVDSLTGVALRCQGLAGDDAETLAEAARSYADSPRTPEHALACEDAGTAYVRRGQPRQARPLLEQAVALYERLDATRDLARVDALLREAGIRRSYRRAHAPTRTGWDSLTPTERTVAALVAEGLSSPQIGDRLYISRRTVQTHLAHIFAKLDMNSRAQLAAEVIRHRVHQPVPGATAR